MRTHTSHTLTHTQSHTQLGPGTARIFPKSFDSSFVFSLFAVSAACHVYFIPATQRGESRDSWLDSRLPKPPTSFYFPSLCPLPVFCWRHLLVALLPPGFFILFASCSFLFFCISSFFLATADCSVHCRQHRLWRILVGLCSHLRWLFFSVFISVKWNVHSNNSNNNYRVSAVRVCVFVP